MASSILQLPITADHFDEFSNRETIDSDRADLERKIEAAIEVAEALLAAAHAAAELLDELDGDADVELNGDEFDAPNQRLGRARYGIDQSRPPLNQRAAENRPAWLL